MTEIKVNLRESNLKEDIFLESIRTSYRKKIWSKFVKAKLSIKLKVFSLL